jgi:hypothetical protein
MSNTNPALNRDNVWVRNERDFAVRVEERDLRLIRDSGLRVEEGTRALLLEDGKLVETLRAGFIDMKSHKGGLIWRLFRTPERLVVILTDDADAIIEFAYDRLVTRDNREVAVSVELVFAIEHPALFFKNLMRSRNRVMYAEFERRYSREVSDALVEAVGEKTFDDLGQTRDLKSDIAVSLDNHLNTSLKSDGLKLVSVRSVRWTGEDLDRLRKDREHRREIDAMLQEIDHARDDETVREKLHEADIEALVGKLRRAREQTRVLDDDEFEQMKRDISKRLAGVKQEVEGEAEEMPWRKKRLEQNREWRRIVDEYDISTMKETFDAEKIKLKLLADNEKNKLFTQDEMDELVAELSVRAKDREDKVMVRAMISKKLELKEFLELKLMDIDARYRIDSEEHKASQALAIMQAENRQKIELDELKHQLEIRRLELEKDHLADEKQAALDRMKQLQEMDLDKQREMTDLEIKEKKARLGQEMLKLMNEVERLDEEEGLRIKRENVIKTELAALERKKIEQAMRLEEQTVQFEQKMKEMTLLHEQTLSRNAQLGDLPLEKILALTEENPGDVIRKLKQEEHFKDMTPEQIMTSQLKDLPVHATKAFESFIEKAESARIQSIQDAHNREIRDLLERQQHDDRTRWDREKSDLSREKKDFMDAMFDSRHKTEQNIADILKASKSDGGHGPVIVTQGGGGQVISPSGGGDTRNNSDEVDVRCPGCGTKITRRLNYCPECGKELNIR